MCCVCLFIVTCEEQKSVHLPEGLVLVQDFVSPEEEVLLLAAIDWSSTNDDITGEVLCIELYLVCIQFLSYE